MQSSFAQPTRTNSTAIAVVVLMHAAGITALALAKTEVFRTTPPPMTLVDVPLPKDPPPVPKPPESKPPTDLPKPRDIFVLPPVVDLPIPQPPVQGTNEPVVELPSWNPPGQAETTKLPDPPPPPEPKKIEPARARANLGSYVSDTDYPAAAIRSEEQGTTRFRLNVGTDGRVTGCTVTGSSGSSALDSATCRILKQRARFTPARDSAGNPTPDTVANAIKWVLPE